MKRIFKTLVGVIALGLLFVLGGCGAGKVREPVTVEIDEDVEVVMVEQVKVKGRDTSMSFTASLPEGWIAIDASADRPEAQFVRAETPQDIKLDSTVITVRLGSAHLEADQVLRMYVSEEDEKDVAEMEVGGLKGWTFGIERLGKKSQYIVVPEKGHIIQTTITPPEAVENVEVQAILRSMEFHMTE